VLEKWALRKREKKLAFGSAIRFLSGGQNNKPKGKLLQLTVKRVLNLIQHFVGFIYRDIRIEFVGKKPRIQITVQAHQSITAIEIRIQGYLIDAIQSHL